VLEASHRGGTPDRGSLVTAAQVTGQRPGSDSRACALARRDA
jgi:hypothetical protein